MKKLLITSTDLMMIQFLVPHVQYLSENGFHVEIACSEVGGRMEEVRKAVEGFAKAVHTVRLVRSPVSATNFKGYRDMKRLLEKNHYDIIWTNEPVMGVVTRLAARRSRGRGTKVFYMAHGFHFFTGASMINWALYYPVERIMAHYCDAIVTMNQEDYDRAVKFKTGQVHKIHGVGLDTQKFKVYDADMTAQARQKLRKELDLTEESFIVLSVGELSKRKNQEVIIRALGMLNDPAVHYVLCGKGDLRHMLEELAKEQGIADQVHFLGYRKDIPDICAGSDCFAFPSLQEGLPFALMEAMQMGLLIVCSRIRGNTDLIKNAEGGLLCDAKSAGDFATAIRKIRTMGRDSMVSVNREVLEKYDLESTKEYILRILK